MALYLELYVFCLVATAGLLRVLWSVSYSFTPWLMEWDLWIYPASLFLAPLPVAILRRSVRLGGDQVYLASFLIRAELAFMMSLYAVSKVLVQQFVLSSSDMDSRVNGATGVVKAWAFFGHSNAYQMFLGCGELAGAVLLLFECSVPVGAILLAAMLVNIVFANFTHDIGVRANSSLYLSQALLLLWPERYRVIQFVTGRAIAARVNPSISSRHRKLWLASKVLIAFATLAYISYNQWMHWVHKPLPNPLIGIWAADRPGKFFRLRFDDERKGSLSVPGKDRVETRVLFNLGKRDLVLQSADSRETYFRGTVESLSEDEIVLRDRTGAETYRRIRP